MQIVFGLLCNAAGCALVADLATLTRNTVRFGEAPPITMLARPTPLQDDVFHRVGLAL